ncbi:hypothetical protein [Flavobacterium aquicola]|uniref:Lipoprotein n=1 Tax=Flavobacterium aquicola TaxID=1682742 RepID=A0A3E0DXP9_9FLAO|nr:hypothetical protein [Flavobacterium aquicola]REG90832.1 hypothetical protein C8P67_11844 [Flavobacterium aquicola]
MKLKIVLIIIAVIFMSSCTLIPCSSTAGLTDLDNKVSKKELIGNYELDDWTKKLIPELKNSNSKLSIKKNGQIEITNIPTAVFNDFLHGERIIDKANGTWKFPQKSDANEIITKMIFSLESESNNTVSFWKIFSQNGKLTIFIEFGDPDNCTAARFIKI